MKKSHILCGVLVSCLLGGLAFSAPRLGFEVTKTSRNEGNLRSGVAISCSSTAWTAALSANPARRSAVLQTLSSSSYNVCLSSMSTVGFSCSAVAPGIRLEPGMTYTDYGESILYCRVVNDSGSAVYVYGMDYSDAGDGSGG